MHFNRVFSSKKHPAIGVAYHDYGKLCSCRCPQELHQEMGQEVGKVADDLAPFQNKNLSPEQQAALTQLMSNKAQLMVKSHPVLTWMMTGVAMGSHG